MTGSLIVTTRVMLLCTGLEVSDEAVPRATNTNNVTSFCLHCLEMYSNRIINTCYEKTGLINTENCITPTVLTGSSSLLKIIWYRIS